MAAPDAADAAQAGKDPARAVGLTFGDFLAKMKDPAAADLVRNIKSFIRQFEERPAGQAVDPEADSAAVQAFLAQSEAVFRQHPVWRGCQPEVLDQAVEGLEKYVMSKVWRQTFGASAEDRERDERYQRLMQALGFVDLPTLMGADVQPDEKLLGMAQGEFLKMDRYKAPRDKLLCLVNVKTMVENIVGLAAKNGANIGGADAFFPVFLFVLIRSRLPRLASNVEYVKRFRMRSRLCGQFDYMLCNLESGAMYLDTVNYEHLSVSQEAFLRHLAAAGIPEAHLELRRMQQEQQQAEWGQAEVEEAAAGAAAGAGAGGGPAADYDTPQGDADVLAGLQLADDGGSLGEEAADGRVSGLGSAPASMPATPMDAAAALFGGGDSTGAAWVDNVSRPSQQSPTVLGAGASGNGAFAAAGDSRRPGIAAAADSMAGAAAGQQQQQQQLGGGFLPRGLSFESASELGSMAEQQELRWRQQQQQQTKEEAAAAAAAAAAVAAAAAQQEYAEAALIEEMVAEGTRHVMAAEAAGQLQQRYPFMYAQAEDLSLAEVQAVLVGYKELMLRYEALSRALQQQLGLGGASSNGGSLETEVPWQTQAEGQATAAGAAIPLPSPGHRGKVEQQLDGFGSLIPPVQLETGGSMQHGAGVLAAQGSPAAAAGAAPGPASARWSPGGLLQRIASRGKEVARSVTPPKDRRGSRAAAAAEASAEVAAQQQQQGAAGGVPKAAGAAAKAVSPGKQGPHPFFTTLFGGSGSGSSSSPKVAAQPRTQAQQQEMPTAAPAAAAAPQGGADQQEQPSQPAAAPAASSASLRTAAAAEGTELGAAQRQQGEQEEEEEQQLASGDSAVGAELSFGYEGQLGAQPSSASRGDAEAAAGGASAGAPAEAEASSLLAAVAAVPESPAGGGGSLLDAFPGEPLPLQVPGSAEPGPGGEAGAAPLLQSPAHAATPPPPAAAAAGASAFTGSLMELREPAGSRADAVGGEPAPSLLDLDPITQPAAESEPAAAAPMEATAAAAAATGQPDAAAPTAAVVAELDAAALPDAAGPITAVAGPDAPTAAAAAAAAEPAVRPTNGLPPSAATAASPAEAAEVGSSAGGAGEQSLGEPPAGLSLL